jgi:branched-chain amino acid transport system ATP-binding protein
MAGASLRIQGLTRRFGGLVAVDDVDLELESGRLNAIIGPNGAGKTTLFNLVTGLIPADSGHVHFDGIDLVGMKPHQIAARGVSRTLQIKSVFGGLTVADNVRAAVMSRRGIGNPFRPAVSYTEVSREVSAILEEIGLESLAAQKASTLSYGDVALLELALAVANGPKLLLLDEPICGMSPSETERTVRKIQELSKRIDVVIIEHDMEVVFAIADHITVMAQGRVLAQGAPAEIAKDKEVQAVYLGSSEDED